MFILEIVKYFTASLEVSTFPTLPSFSPQILIRDHEDLSQALFSDVIECIGGFCASVSLTKQAVSLDPETAWGKVAGNSQKTMVEAAFDGDLTSLAPHQRLPELPLVPRQKPGTSAAV